MGLQHNKVACYLSILYSKNLSFQYFKKLMELNLSQNKIKNEGAQALGQALRHNSVISYL